MTPREAFLAALGGQDAVAFSALAWWRLPAFLNAEERPEWWLDAGYCGRALSEVAVLCGLEAIQVPLLRVPDCLTGGDVPPVPPEPYEALIRRPDVEAALTVADRLATQGRHGVLGVLPSLSDMARRWPQAPPEDLEDDTSAVTSRLFVLGADGVVIHGEEPLDVRATMESLSRLAKHFGRVILGVTPDSAWSSDNRFDVVSVIPRADWTTIQRGVLLATVDLSAYSPRELTGWLQSRPRAG